MNEWTNEVNLFSSTIHNSLKVERAQISISRWKNRQTVVDVDNRILFGHKKEWSTDTGYNMDEPQRHDAKWKEPDAIDHVWYDSIYVKCPELANP